jgi:hypothetical protein
MLASFILFDEVATLGTLLEVLHHELDAAGAQTITSTHDHHINTRLPHQIMTITSARSMRASSSEQYHMGHTPCVVHVVRTRLLPILHFPAGCRAMRRAQTQETELVATQAHQRRAGAFVSAATPKHQKHRVMATTTTPFYA